MQLLEQHCVETTRLPQLVVSTTTAVVLSEETILRNTEDRSKV